jgi:hypothetical protein
MTPARKMIVWGTGCGALVLCTLLKFCSIPSREVDSQTVEKHNAQIDAILRPVKDGKAVPNAPLLEPDAKTLQILAAEIEIIPVLQKQQRSNTWERERRIREAFKVLGTNGAPLIPRLASDFLTGLNPGDSGWALVHIGHEAWPVLLQGLTSSIPQVRNSAVEAVGYTGSETAQAALPQVLAFLTNASAPLRGIAASTLGRLAVDSQAVVSPLVDRAAQDSDAVVRLAAVKSLGRLGTTNTNVIQALQRVSELEKDEDVREEAKRSLRRIIKV